jgi:TfoX/Sxy family transcriptional regulator of competence genes
MASSQSTVDFILDQMAAAGAVTAKKMFGEYGLYLDGRMFGMVCDDNLFVKPTAAGKRVFPAEAMGVPYPGAKPCYQIPPERWEDLDWLSQLAAATAAALPLPAKKGRKLV